MFDIVRYTPERADEWNLFVAQSKNGTFLFDRRYMDYHADRFADRSLMFYDGRGRLYALLPACQENGVLYSHRGLSYGGLVMTEKSTTDDVCTLFAELNSYLALQGISRVVYKAVPWIYHRLPSEEDLFALFVRCHAQLVGRDVSSTIFAANPLKWRRDRRYKANKARSNGITVCQSDDYAAFWPVLADNLWSCHHARPVHTLEEIKLLHQRFPDNIQLWVAHSADGLLVAGTVVYVSGGTVHCQYISASPLGKQLHAVDALLRHILTEAYHDKALFDLGTSNIPGGHELHTSLIFQKEGFGGRAVCYDTYAWQPQQAVGS
ncbi:MAG: GNAT family N-acetyltransferase [Prevotella sp.]|nr:GNAT family N-acetyltransferase [Prevotella sp.]